MPTTKTAAQKSNALPNHNLDCGDQAAFFLQIALLLKAKSHFPRAKRGGLAAHWDCFP